MMADELKIDVALPLLENPNLDKANPEITPKENAPSARDRVIIYIHTHLHIFAIPSTLCFIGAVATFANTQSFTSLVERVGEDNAYLILAAIAMLWFPFLYYSRKLRGVYKILPLLQLGVECLFLFTDMSLYLLFLTYGYALLVFLLLGCSINAADFAGIGSRVSNKCNPTIWVAVTVATSHWGLTYFGFLVLVLLYVYMVLRGWVYNSVN